MNDQVKRYNKSFKVQKYFDLYLNHQLSANNVCSL